MVLCYLCCKVPDHVFFNSASVSRLQAFPRRSLFLLTSEFRGRAWRVVFNVGFLRVCPIQPKFSLICMPIGSCHALFPKFFICDPFRPSDVEQAPETYIVKCLDLLESRFAHSLCLYSIQYGSLHIGVEYPLFGSSVNVSSGPDVL